MWLGGNARRDPRARTKAKRSCRLDCEGRSKMGNGYFNGVVHGCCQCSAFWEGTYATDYISDGESVVRQSAVWHWKFVL